MGLLALLIVYPHSSLINHNFTKTISNRDWLVSSVDRQIGVPNCQSSHPEIESKFLILSDCELVFNLVSRDDLLILCN